ncbi:hypothetical protein B4133_3553 [Bacillus altitudinis]|nr:hypothetical protein B4133_3553 [Bacillus altitudinis]
MIGDVSMRMKLHSFFKKEAVPNGRLFHLYFIESFKEETN